MIPPLVSLDLAPSDWPSLEPHYRALLGRPLDTPVPSHGRGVPFIFDRSPGAEFCEVAPMSMERLGNPRLDVFYSSGWRDVAPNPGGPARARRAPTRALESLLHASSLGNRRPLPDLLAAAGLRYDLSSDAIEPLPRSMQDELPRHHEERRA